MKQQRHSLSCSIFHSISRSSSHSIFYFMFLLLFMAVLVCVPQVSAVAAEPVIPQFSVGFKVIGANVPGSNEPQEIAVWYPRAVQGTGTVELDGYRFAAVNNARIAEAQFPLLMLSHDMASNNIAQNAIAIELTKKGFIVAAPTHAGDNSKNSELLFLPKQILYRPLHVSHALDLVLTNEFFKDHIQHNAIGLIGVGTGASTALLLAGATPFPFDSNEYCENAPYDTTYCNSWAKNRLQLFRKDAMVPIVPQSVDQEVTRIIDLALIQAKIYPEEQVMVMKPPLYFTGGDKRFSAVALLAPGFAQLFPRESVLFLEIPVYVASAGKDVYYFPHLQAEPLVKVLKSAAAHNIVQYSRFEEADHWAFFGFCEETEEGVLKEMCTQLSQTEHTKLTNSVATELTTFFIQQTVLPTLENLVQATLAQVVAEEPEFDTDANIDTNEDEDSKPTNPSAP